MWLTESLRLTVFPHPPEVDVAVNWWQAVTGEAPATHTVQRLGPVLQEHGPIQNSYCNLSLQFQPGRLDWVMSPIIPPSLKLEGFPNFDSFDSATEKFRALFLKWIRVAPPFNRLAIGSILVLPVQDKADGYREIQKYLPAVKLDAENSADFSYGINRPRQSQIIAGLRINRLSNWSVAKLSGIRIELGDAGQSRAIESAEGLSACRLQVDVNTQPERTEAFVYNDREALLDELMRINAELVDRGDVP